MREVSSEDNKQGFVLKNREGIVRIVFAELEYVEVINKTVFFYMANGETYEATAALADFEGKLLARLEFIKPHRSYLVNLNYVQLVGKQFITTKNGHSIPVSRQRQSQVQDAYLRFVSGKPEVSFGPWRILLVDDDDAELNFWADILRKHGCIVHLAKNGREALRLAALEPCDGILLDVMIPGEDGFSICEKLRGLTQAPVIFLSCLTESGKQLEGFAAGGIDYITKDTPVELFWAKVKTRIKLASFDRIQMCHGSLLIDLTGRKVLVNGKELCLSPIEFDILWQLSEHAGQVLPPEEIYGMVWGEQPCEDVQMVQMHVSRLRRKLEKAYGEHCFIETVWGEGYRFAPMEGR